MHTKSVNGRPNVVNVITLGCSKNRVDSEVLLAQLKGNGIQAAHESQEAADVVVVNTCGFIDEAKEESIETILHYIQAKTDGHLDRLYVSGCLSERYREDLRQEMPEVDGFFGTMDYPALLKQLDADYRQELIGERLTTTDSHYAYLKIAEGCNRPCGFCAIPLMRGKHRSRPIEALVHEAEFLVSRGVQEIMLIAQELTFYGLDIYGERKLAALLEALAQVKGLHWIRLHYAYPSGFPENVLPVIREHPNICNYLDIPLQHAADSVLKRMRRGITLDKTKALVDTIRHEVPGIAIRTTFLVGYPGETDADFQTLLDFQAWAQFERAGVFTYSHEEGTYAHGFADDVPQELKQERAEILMAEQQEISFALNQGRVGQTLTVLIDRKEGGHWVGRTEYDSPEVDNEVLISAEAPLAIGRFFPIQIISAEAFDLYGQYAP